MKQKTVESKEGCSSNQSSTNEFNRMESFEISEEDQTTRLDEMVAIQSIYPDLFFQDSINRIILKFEGNIRLTVDLPYDYPSKSPPCFELSGPDLKLRERIALVDRLNEECLTNLGMPVLFAWINVVNEFVQNLTPTVEKDQEEVFEDKPHIVSTQDIFDIKHGEVFSDRKSHFQAHFCEITSKEQATNVIRQLLTNNKIARATHNMYAYRLKQIKDGREFSIHDCFDDGEHGASSKMLEILEKMKVENAIVSQKHFNADFSGPDRFRIINNLTREIIEKYGKQEVS